MKPARKDAPFLANHPNPTNHIKKAIGKFRFLLSLSRTYTHVPTTRADPAEILSETAAAAAAGLLCSARLRSRARAHTWTLLVYTRGVRAFALCQIHGCGAAPGEQIPGRRQQPHDTCARERALQRI